MKAVDGQKEAIRLVYKKIGDPVEEELPLKEADRKLIGVRMVKLCYMKFTSTAWKNGMANPDLLIRDIQEFQRKSGEKGKDGGPAPVNLKRHVKAWYLTALFIFYLSDSRKEGDSDIKHAQEMSKLFWQKCRADVNQQIMRFLANYPAEDQDFFQTELDNNRIWLENQTMSVMQKTQTKCLEAIERGVVLRIDPLVWRYYIEQFAVLLYKLGLANTEDRFLQQREDLLSFVFKGQCLPNEAFNIDTPNLLWNKIEYYCSKNSLKKAKTDEGIVKYSLYERENLMDDLYSDFTKIIINKGAEFKLDTILSRYILRLDRIKRWRYNYNDFAEPGPPRDLTYYTPKHVSERRPKKEEPKHMPDHALLAQEIESILKKDEMDNKIKLLIDRIPKAIAHAFYNLYPNADRLPKDEQEIYKTLAGKKLLEIRANREQIILLVYYNDKKNYKSLIFSELEAVNNLFADLANLLASIRPTINNEAFLSGLFYKIDSSRSGSSFSFYGNEDSFATKRTAIFSNFKERIKEESIKLEKDYLNTLGL